MRTFGQLYLASLREWRRDTTALLWSMMFPVLIALAVGVIFSGGGKIFFRIGVVNEAGAAGEPLAEGFRRNAAMHVFEGSREDELDALEDGRREAVVIIPAQAGVALAGYDGAITDPGEQVPVAVHYDPNSANAQAVVSLVSETLAGIEAQLSGSLPLLSLQSEAAVSEGLRTVDYMLPGILAMALLLNGLYITAGPLISLREKAILRRMGATPLTRNTMLAAQIAFRLTVAVIQAAAVIAIGHFIFNVPVVTDNLPGLAGMVLLGAAMFITFGYALAALARTEESAQALVGVPFLLFTLLSGTLVPLWRVPGWIRPLVDAIPLTYLADGLRQLMVDHNPTFSMTRNILVLIVWLAICTALAVRFFRWEPQR